MKITRWKVYILRILDIVMAMISLCLAFVLVDGIDFLNAKFLPVFLSGMAIQAVAFAGLFYALNIYRVIWRYASLQEMMRLFLATFFSQMVAYVVHMSVGLSLTKLLSGFQYLKLHIFAGMFCVVFVGVSRLAVYMIEHKKVRKGERLVKVKNNTMIIGAGEASHLLLYDIALNQHSNEYNVVCIVDDNPAKKGMHFGKIPVVGDRYTIAENVIKYGIKTIVFAIPSCPKEEKAKILDICLKTKCTIKTMPAVNQMVEEHMPDSEYVRRIKNVEIDELLGREPIKINLDMVMNYVSDRVVMVTGGGGSIGSELCRQIAPFKPKKLIIFDIYENSTYDIQLELKRKYPSLDLTALIGSVRDWDRLNMIFEKYKPEIVYHAAAHKHVPLMEDSPNEAIKNNVFGTFNVVQMSDKFKVKKFVLISTDKAVNPTNIMGASKRICEMIVQNYNKYSKTEFVAVRFGNVLGSNGSVIPLFKKQIENGGPVTVTHPDIIRYFMTIPEAVSLVLQAGASAKGGEIFVLDMGEPVKILTLAENLIRLSGFEPYTEIGIKFTGLRPGEKLYEELLMNEEGLQATDNKLIHIGRPIEFDEDKFFSVLSKMKHCMADDDVDMRSFVKEIVPTYIMDSKNE